jgi:DNA polymerase (family 10)
MDNRQIAKQFDLIARLMELHEENPFRIRSYTTAYQNLRKLDVPLTGLKEEELMAIPGIGQAVAAKIREFIESGRIDALEKLLAKTPVGLIDVLNIKGIGPKKVRVLWKELGITDIGELEYACYENRLLSLKGFGQKTQDSILTQIDFHKRNAGQILLHQALELSGRLLAVLSSAMPAGRFEVTGDLRRKMETVSVLEFIGTEDRAQVINILLGSDVLQENDGKLNFQGLPVEYHVAAPGQFGTRWFFTTGPDAFVNRFNPGMHREESDVFHEAGCSFIVPELRDRATDESFIVPERLISLEDQRGVIHAHSTWSDGSNTIRQMADACREKGYGYLVLTDHSRSAFYANGLNEERIYKQWEEMAEINRQNPDFRVFRGIESDILYNGELDYADEILDGFELVIASVHSNLNMDQEAAHRRLIGAIEHPRTHILGHMTGRLLLSRPGYPVDHQRIIDACAGNRVAIEINANPHRLDIDWRWIPYALEKGVKICISPDAHNVKGIDDMQFGVWMARKAGAGAADCLNTLDAGELANWAAAK